jgi:hypothetical protein
MIRIRRTLLAAVSLATLVCLGAPVGAQEVATDAAETMADVKIEVLESGESPRRELRYAPKVGDSQRMRIELSSSMSQMGMTNRLPTMAFTTTVMFDKVESGEIHARVRVDSAEVVDDTDVQPMIAAQVKAGLQAASGKVATLITNDRGITQTFAFSEQDKNEPMLRNTLDSIENVLGTLLAPLPEEEVGVGATWGSKSRISRNGISIDQNITYALTGFEGETLNLEIKADHSATDQTIEQQGMKITVESLRSKGVGAATVALDEMAPTDGSMSTEVKTDLSFSQNGMPQKFTQTASSKSVISRPE